MRNIIDDQVMATATSDELLARTLAILPMARPNRLSVDWAFGNACLQVYSERINPDWRNAPEAECYLEFFDVLTTEQIATLHQAWLALPAPPKPLHPGDQPT